MTVCVIAGVGVGGFGGFAYYSPLLRPLAHTLGMWLLLVTLVSAKRPLPHAILLATTTLVTAVPAFGSVRVI